MQDKWKGSEDQFTDQAWEQMRQLLDREMPVERDRKRGLIIWWYSAAATVVVLVSIAAWLLWSPGVQTTGQNGNEPVAGVSEKPAAVPGNTIIDSTGTATQTLAKPDDVTGKVISRNSGKSIDQSQVIVQSLPGESIINTNATENFEGDNNKSLVNTDFKEIVVIEADELPGTDGQSEKAAFSNNNAESTFGARQPLKTPGLIDQKEVTSIDNPFPEMDFVATPLLEKKGEKRMVLGLEGGLLGPGLEYSAGITAPVVSRGRWSLQAGLAFSTHNQDVALVSTDIPLTLDGSETEEDIGVTNPGPNFGGDPATLRAQFQAAVDDQYLGLRFLDLPVLVAYQVNSRFSLNAGMRFSYLISAKNETGNTDTARFQNINLNKSLLFENKQNGNNILRSYHNDFDFGVVGGGSYYLSEKLRLSLRYHLGVNDLLESELLTVRNRYFQLSATYFIR